MWKTKRKQKKKNARKTSYGLIHPIVKPRKQTLGNAVSNKQFPPEHEVNKIFNGKTLNRSYPCMPNQKSLINSDNENTQRPTSKYLKMVGVIP